MKIRLQNVRISYPALFVPDRYKEGDKPRYKADFLLGPDSQAAVGDGDFQEAKKAVHSAFVAVTKEAWGDKANEMWKVLRANNKMAFRDGDLKTGNDAESYNGLWYLAARAAEKKKPKIFDASGKQLMTDEGLIYGGCFVHAVVDIWPQKDANKQINCTLLAVKFYKDGDAFGGGARADASDFEGMMSDAGDSGFDDVAGSDFDEFGEI